MNHQNQMRSNHANAVIEEFESSCPGMVFIAFADYVYWLTGSKEKANEIFEMARQLSLGRTYYGGTARSILWDIPREEANGTSAPWITHNAKPYTPIY